MLGPLPLFSAHSLRVTLAAAGPGEPLSFPWLNFFGGYRRHFEVCCLSVNFSFRRTTQSDVSYRCSISFDVHLMLKQFLLRLAGSDMDSMWWVSIA
jgi:hypothetical protein